MSSIVNPVSGAAASGSTTPPASNSTTSSTDQLASESTFLKLLVAQLQNQDPSSPSDPTQFVGQLTQYSELEQLININTNVQKLAPAAAAGTATTTPATTPQRNSQF